MEDWLQFGKAPVNPVTPRNKGRGFFRGINILNNPFLPRLKDGATWSIGVNFWLLKHLRGS
jgi:hypothetical protein